MQVTFTISITFLFIRNMFKIIIFWFHTINFLKHYIYKDGCSISEKIRLASEIISYTLPRIFLYFLQSHNWLNTLYCMNNNIFMNFRRVFANTLSFNLEKTRLFLEPR